MIAAATIWRLAPTKAAHRGFFRAPIGVQASELLVEVAEEVIPDAALIGAAPRVEHYEIAGYSGARKIAEMLGHTEAAQLLQRTFDEEKDTNLTLTELALTVFKVNAQKRSEL